MSKLTHTHRGHCQLCGSVQAIDVETSIVAKHGYTVSGGYFAGTCPGSDKRNLHVERSLADEEIAHARAKAINCDKTAAKFETKTAHPAYVWGGEIRMVRASMVRDSVLYTRYRAPYSELKEHAVDVKWAEASSEYQEKGRSAAIADLRRTAEGARHYADRLEEMANRIFEKVAPYLVADLKLRGFEVGQTVRINGRGRNGYDAKIEAIEDQRIESRGFRARSIFTTVPHARITKPAKPARIDKKGRVLEKAYDAHTYWTPLRFLKKPKDTEDET